MCDFCRHNEIGEHYSHCARNEPNAQAEYDRGWLDGKRGRECASDNTAYVVGWSRGESALEDWREGYNWYGM